MPAWSVDVPEEVPLDVVPAPHNCPVCDAPRTLYHPHRFVDEAAYACSTTTRMLRAGFHGDRENAALAGRARAVYRQFLVGLGHTPNEHDPML